MWYWVRNANITLDTNRCIPSVTFPNNSYLLNCKPIWDRSMHIYQDCCNFRQLNMQVSYWIMLELRKQQRLKLPNLLESGKARPPCLKVFPTPMQLFNYLLENLTRNLTQPRKILFGERQIVKLKNLARKLQISRKDVLFQGRASVNQTLATITPILYFSQCIVKCTTTDIHPINKCLLLNGVGVDSIAVGECQHPTTVAGLLTGATLLNVNL